MGADHVGVKAPGQTSGPVFDHYRIQRALDATVWPHLFGGCHLGRDTAAAIEQAGFSIARLDRFLFPEARSPVSFHITGQAAKLQGGYLPRYMPG